jgi:30S ribosomal protein 3
MKNFSLKVLWLDNSIAFSLDQSININFIPLTEFYFWPQKDAWELIKLYLEGLNWISHEEAVFLLNRITEIINIWQTRSDLGSSNINNLKILFPDVCFIGSE